MVDKSFWDVFKDMPKREFSSYITGHSYVTYPFFKLFGFNKWGLVIPRIIANILGFLFLYGVCQKFFKTTLGYLVTFILVSFNQNLIWHSFEIRPYAFLPPLALAVFYFMDMMIAQNRQMSRLKRYALGLFFIFVIWFHPDGVLMILFSGLFLWFAQEKQQRSFPAFIYLIKYFSVIFLITMPLWLISVFGPHLAPYEINVFQYIPNPMYDLKGFLRGVIGNLISNKSLKFLFAGLFLGFLLPHKDYFKQVGFFLILVVLPLEVILAVHIWNNHWFIQRFFVWIIPFFAIFLGWSFDVMAQLVLTKVKKI